jgi:chromosome segregation ATPase
LKCIYTSLYNKRYTKRNLLGVKKMPRPGITYIDVAKTAIKLIEKNIHPSIEEIRKDLGTGSNSTINKYLRLWREKQGNQIEAEKGLPETLLIAVKGIYEGMQAHATHKITLIETETKQKISALEALLDQLTCQHNVLLQNNVALENKSNEQELHALELQKIINMLNQNADKKIAENELLQERLDDKKSEIERLTQQLKHAQHNLEHYRESIKQERIVEKQRYEAQINKLEQQTHHHQIHSVEMQNKISTLRQKTESLKSDKDKIETELQHALRNGQKRELLVQRHEINYKHLSEKHDKLNSEYNLINEQTKFDKNAIKDMQIKMTQLLERISILEDILKKSEEKINSLSTKNIFLMQEKKELAHQLEKIQTVKQ